MLLKKQNCASLWNLDDGLQDNSVNYDMSIVCQQFKLIGNGMTIPAGPLRESLSV